MAISHLCLECGTDLAFTRPAREKRYHLNVVTCPTCANRSVRQRHPLRIEKRRLIRLDAALTVLVFQFTMLLVFAVTNLAGGNLLFDLVDSWDSRRWGNDRWIIVGLFGFVFPILTGVWLAAGFSHWKRRRAFFALWCVMLVPIGIISFVSGMENAEHSVLHDPRTVPTIRILVTEIASEFVMRLLMTSLLMIPALIGLAIGRPLILISDAFRRWRWRWRRRRRRLRSSAV